MNRQGRVLVVDDLKEWREFIVEALERGEFQVDAAATTQEAQQRLSENYYHILVLDMRMNDLEPENQEGMDLLRNLSDQGLDQEIGIIILSAYSTKPQMRQAFTHSHIVDFQEKDDFEGREFLRQVQHLLATQVPINLDLHVHWKGVSGSEQVVAGLEVAQTRIKQGTPLQKRVGAELDDLLCRLFHQAESVLVSPLKPGQSGAGVLQVQPFFADSAGQPVVVKFGDRTAIKQEHQNFKEYVEPFVGGGRSTTVRAVRSTTLLGGIVYSLLGSASDQFQDFDNFYRDADAEAICVTLDHLFRNTCGAWYASRGNLQPQDLTAEYQQTLRFTPDNLQQAFERLKSVQGKTRLQFRSLPDGRRFTNPLLALAGPNLMYPTYTCTTHGDFNEKNILLDDTGQVWLIDFFRTGKGHILRDVAELDSVVRIKLLDAEEASLVERLHLEETLLQITRFSEVDQLSNAYPTENDALAKAYAIVVHLRRLAHQIALQNPANDVTEYYAALFYYALNTIRYYSLPTVQREHALLSASLLADYLGLAL